MRLPALAYQAPDTLAELLTLKREHGPAAAVLAGGTDLMVRLKQRLARPDLLLSLRNIDELRRIEMEPIYARLGAAVSLEAVLTDQSMAQEFPGLIEALSRVGAPSFHRHAATLGGNLLLDTRCLMYNQSAFWRRGSERCFKAGGQVCLALPESKECSSACLSDGAPMLVALSAQVKLASVAGERVISAAALFTGKGEGPFALGDDEILVQVLLPRPAGSFGSAYEKLTPRSFIDFPLVSAAACLGMSKGKIERARLVLGAAGPKPVVVEEADAILRGRAPEEALIRQVAAAAENLAAGLIINNVWSEAEYRRQMVAVATRRALKRAADRAV